MKKFEFDIPIYSYHVVLLYAENDGDGKDIEKAMIKHRCDKESTQSVVNDIGDGWEDGAITFSNKGRNLFVGVYFPLKSDERITEVLAHEKRHMEDKICKYLEIRDDDEAVAYLAGFLAKWFRKFEDIIKNKSNDGKRKD